MSCCTSQVNGVTVNEPDPTKHVNFNLGMVLGVDDFTQEFAYLSGRDQWLARDLIGYGTAHGLALSVDKDAHGPRVLVEPGAALSPRGQLICVSSAQCAYLNQWLAANDQELRSQLISPPASNVRLYVVLCYRACPTDNAPIPGEPCRSEDELMAPSRITDDFRLELRLQAPHQREEDALRDFAAWLKLIEIVDQSSSAASLEEFLAAIRTAAKPWLSPPDGPLSPLSPIDAPPGDFMFGSPPGSLVISATDATEYMRAAFRVWTTELRPKWLGRWHGCAPDQPADMSAQEEDCVLLAALDVPVLHASPGAAFVVDDSLVPGVKIDESTRPYLVHMRMLQEWLLSREQQSFPSDEVVRETEFGKQEFAGTSAAFSRADHTHGTPVLPDLAGDVVGPIGAALVTGLQTSPVSDKTPKKNQILTFVTGGPGVTSKWTPADPPVPTLAGDVTGAAGDTTVARLRRVDVDAAQPLDGQALVFSAANNRWKPANVGAGGGPVALAGDVQGAAGANKVATIQAVRITLPAIANLVDGQVLTVRNQQLQLEAIPAQPASVDAVEHARGLGRYVIVAAGTVRGDGQNQAPVYNKLVVTALALGQVTMTFDGYRPPTDLFQYVVKVLPKFNERIRAPLVMFDSFLRAEGFVLRINDGSEAVDQSVLKTLELMVEVSQYFSR